MTTYRPPADCPVCGHALATTRLGCESCGTEVLGHFEQCSLCRLDDAELDVLTVFLASRGNIREVAKHLGVSYPTARARLTSLLGTLGLAGEAEDPGILTRDQVLSEVAAGVLTPDEAARLLLEL